MFTVAFPGFTRKAVNGLGPDTTPDVSPASVTVNKASVNGVPPKVPVAVVVIKYVIGVAWTRAIGQNKPTAKIVNKARIAPSSRSLSRPFGIVHARISRLGVLWPSGQGANSTIIHHMLLRDGIGLF